MKIPLILFLSLSWGFAEGQALGWSKRIGNATNQILHKMRTDPEGNIILFGTFQTYPLEGGSERKSFGGVDLFIHKMDAEGNTLWFRNIGCFGNDDHAYDMDVDSAGNVFVLGELGKGLGAVGMLLQAGEQDTLRLDHVQGHNIFFAKYDPAGKLLWARQFERKSPAYLKLIQVGREKVIVGGEFRDRTRILGQSDSLTSDEYMAMLAEFRGDGGVISMSAIDSGMIVNFVREDGEGNRFLGLLTEYPYRKSIVQKQNASGGIIWSRRLQNEGISGSISIRDMVVDSTGEVYIAGEFTESSAAFRLEDGRDTVLISTGQSEFYLMKLDSEGRMKWLRSGLEGFSIMSNMTMAPDRTLNFVVSLFGRILKIDLDGNLIIDLKAKKGRTEDYSSCTALKPSGAVLYAFSFSDSMVMHGNTFRSSGYLDILLFEMGEPQSSTLGKVGLMHPRMNPDLRAWWLRFAPNGRRRELRD